MDVLISIDFSKIIDTVNHGLLLSTLHFVGTGEEALAPFESYQMKKTREITCNCGVTRESILGPLSFPIYTPRMATRIFLMLMTSSRVIHCN